MNLSRPLPTLVTLALVTLVAGSTALAQAPNPADFDFGIDPAAPTARPGGSIEITTFVNARADGGQGWSYGVIHDREVLEVMSSTIVGTDAEATLTGGFQNTELSRSQDAEPLKLGWTQGVVLSFTMPIFVPIQDNFTMGKATYEVIGTVCEGVEEDISTSISFTDQLSATPGGPLVDINFTVNGQGVIPTMRGTSDVTVACAGAPTAINLRMAADAGDTLIANQADTLGIDITATNATGDGGTVDVQAWEYGITLDGSLLAVSDFGVGEDAGALNGGNGPAFAANEEIDNDGDGTTDAVIGGAVVDFSKAQAETLPLPDGTAVKIGRLALSSAISIPLGQPARTTTLQFDTIEGNKKTSTIENLFTVDAQSVTPDFAEALDVTLEPSAVDESGLFVRGDANDDTRVDIADGIWVIQFLFYGGTESSCLGSADANNDNRLDISDAMFIFNYQLQPDAALRGGPLAPPPAAPFPGCGRDEDLDPADCMPGSTRCG